MDTYLCSKLVSTTGIAAIGGHFTSSRMQLFNNPSAFAMNDRDQPEPRVIRSVEGIQSPVLSVSWNCSCTRLAAAVENGAIRIWNVKVDVSTQVGQWRCFLFLC